MEKFRYYMKRLGRCFLFSHYATFMTFMISLISVQFFVDMKSRTLALVIELVVLLFYGFTEILAGMAFGTRQYKAKCSNAYQRLPDSPDLLGYYEKRDTEFAPMNGTLIGLLSHYPLYIFLIVFACLKPGSNAYSFFYTAIMGSTAVVSAPVAQIFGLQGAMPAALALVIVPITAIFTTAGYFLGAENVKRNRAQAERIEEKLHDGEEEK